MTRTVSDSPSLENQLFSWNGWDQIDTAIFYFYKPELVIDLPGLEKGTQFDGVLFDIENSKLTFENFDKERKVTDSFEFRLQVTAVPCEPAKNSPESA